MAADDDGGGGQRHARLGSRLQLGRTRVGSERQWRKQSGDDGCGCGRGAVADNVSKGREGQQQRTTACKIRRKNTTGKEKSGWQETAETAEW
jgi:hypothetical protein